jgi:hypothetical protein
MYGRNTGDLLTVSHDIKRLFVLLFVLFWDCVVFLSLLDSLNFLHLLPTLNSRLFYLKAP